MEKTLYSSKIFYCYEKSAVLDFYILELQPGCKKSFKKQTNNNPCGASNEALYEESTCYISKLHVYVSESFISEKNPVNLYLHKNVNVLEDAKATSKVVTMVL